MKVAAIILATISGSLAFRFRGGLWNQTIPRGDFIGRVVFSLMCAAIVMPAHSWLAFAGVTIGLFAAACMPWGDSIDLGNIEGSRLQDCAILALRGVSFTTFPFVLTLLMGHQFPYWFAVMGVLILPCYEIGWRVPSPIYGLRQGPELGEALFGGLLGAALWLT